MCGSCGKNKTSSRTSTTTTYTTITNSNQYISDFVPVLYRSENTGMHLLYSPTQPVYNGEVIYSYGRRRGARLEEIELITSTTYANVDELRTLSFWGYSLFLIHPDDVVSELFTPVTFGTAEATIESHEEVAFIEPVEDVTQSFATMDVSRYETTASEEINVVEPMSSPKLAMPLSEASIKYLTNKVRADLEGQGILTTTELHNYIKLTGVSKFAKKHLTSSKVTSSYEKAESMLGELDALN